MVEMIKIIIIKDCASLPEPTNAITSSDHINATITVTTQISVLKWQHADWVRLLSTDTGLRHRALLYCPPLPLSVHSFNLQWAPFHAITQYTSTPCFLYCPGVLTTGSRVWILTKYSLSRSNLWLRGKLPTTNLWAQYLYGQEKCKLQQTST